MGEETKSKGGCCAGALFLAFLALFVGPLMLFASMFSSEAKAQACTERRTASGPGASTVEQARDQSDREPAEEGVKVDESGIPKGANVAGYGREQLVNAAIIMNAGQKLGLGTRDQTIGVMTAMGESSLKNINYGDAAGPDSRGLFQQRANGAWGSYKDRTTPHIAATNFFKAMKQVKNRAGKEPTIVAHETQRNADPYHYTKYWNDAVRIVEYLADKDLSSIEQGTGGQACTGVAPTSAETIKGGWALPTTGPVTSRQGPRKHPITGEYKNHSGTDIAPKCGTPIHAVKGGQVVYAGPASGYGNYVEIDHGNGLTSRYAHMTSAGVLVKVGQKVKAGDEIGRVGSAGDSTGCHLHLEMRKGGKLIDPEAELKKHGIKLG